eukprot:TRINITY_DN6842_c0_g1_i1.p1 TRINITY_DN6842_c0_g1~~TRINITY_DN6842_c0_g1_i1.p1  ORF type:complete len:943 (-),score=217.31 TRINITY_DN6842_c0_g1_i1:421-3249(-)
MARVPYGGRQRYDPNFADDPEDEGDECDVWVEMQKLRRALSVRISRLEGQVEEVADGYREEAEAQHDLAIEMSSFKRLLDGIQDEILSSSPSNSGNRGKKRSGSGGGASERRVVGSDDSKQQPRVVDGDEGERPQQNSQRSFASQLPQDCRDLEVRAYRAELELKAVKAEMELKVVRAEMELRLFRAEQDLRVAKQEAEGRDGRFWSGQSPNQVQVVPMTPCFASSGEQLSFPSFTREPVMPEAQVTLRHPMPPQPTLVQPTAWVPAPASGGVYYQFEDPSGCGGPTLAHGGGNEGYFGPAYGYSDELQLDLSEFTGVEGMQPECANEEETFLVVHVLDRYATHPLDVLGQGGFSCVRRGVDIRDDSIVAVKSYTQLELVDKGNPEYESTRQYFFKKFVHEVNIFQTLRIPVDMRSVILKQKAKERDSSSAAGRPRKRMSWYIPDAVTEHDGALLRRIFGDFPSSEQLFVQLLDYSREIQPAKDSTEEEEMEEVPGPDKDGVMYVVLELADFTLHDFLEHRVYFGPTLSLPEVTQIFRQLAQIVTALHARNFVHADLKPRNVMHFPSGRWKLIDMDGMVSPGRIAAEEICYTPLYCAPELAAQRMNEETELQVSRHWDVWSLGMSVCELVTLTPVLEGKLQEMDDLSEFLNWLAHSEAEIVVPQQVQDLDPLLADVCQRMITRDTSARISMIEVLLHPFFTGQEGFAALLEKDTKYDVQQGRLYSRSLLYRSAATKVLLLEQREKQHVAFGSRHRSAGPQAIGARKTMGQMVQALSDGKVLEGGPTAEKPDVSGIPTVQLPLKTNAAYPTGGLAELRRGKDRDSGKGTEQQRNGGRQGEGRVLGNTEDDDADGECDEGSRGLQKKKISTAAGLTCLQKLPQKHLLMIQEDESEEGEGYFSSSGFARFQEKAEEEEEEEVNSSGRTPGSRLDALHVGWSSESD